MGIQYCTWLQIESQVVVLLDEEPLKVDAFGANLLLGQGAGPVGCKAIHGAGVLQIEGFALL